MKILLLGEYSNVHWTLAEGLRKLGHNVTVVSNGDFWKDYPRDIDVSRAPGKIGGIKLYIKLLKTLPKLRGYDIVQLINPLFFELKAERLFFFYNYLRKHNRKIVLGAFGMDYYWVSTCCTTMPLRYSDFNIGKELRTNADALKERKDWLATTKEKLNKRIANDCDGIVTGLYEYWVSYQPIFNEKTVFIPFPVQTDNKRTAQHAEGSKVKLFIGISKNRSEYKGTDIMLKAAKDMQKEYADRIELKIADGVPFTQYVELMNGSDAILDQLYSYTPSMNPLEAMSRGIICIGGGEPENYEILNEKTLRPILNVEPNYESCCCAIKQLVEHPEKISQLQQDSITYVKKHHDYLKVARAYEAFYNKLLTKKN